MIRTVAIATVLTAAAIPVAAQQIDSRRLAESQQAKFQVPLCSLKGGGKAFDNGQKTLRKAVEEKDATKRQSQFAEAYGGLTTAVQEDPNNPAHWYYLGRAYLYLGDPAGVDSAFTRAVELAPSCDIDINRYRQNGWAVLANAGLEFVQQQNTDSAMILFRQASLLFRDLPHVFTNMGVIYANSGQADSAAVYFAQAADVAARDTSYTEERDGATLNLAVMYQRLERYPEAINTLQRYLEWHPDDMDAKRSLAQAYRGAGNADSADAIEGRIVATLSSMSADSLDLGELMAVGVGYFRAEQFAKAAQAFETIVERNPYSRDGNYNLANTYLALKEWAKLGTTAKHLLTIDPMSMDALQLLGQSQRNLEQQDSLLATAERIVGLPWNFQVTGFQVGATTTRLTATLTGRAAETVAGDPIEPAPVELVVEFLGAGGTVVDTKEVVVPPIAEGMTQDFSVETTVSGVLSWRYRKKAAA